MKKLAIIAILALVILVFGGCSANKEPTSEITTTEDKIATTATTEDTEKSIWDRPWKERDMELIKLFKDVPEHEEKEIDGVTLFKSGDSIYEKSVLGNDSRICSAHCVEADIYNSVEIEGGVLIYDEDRVLRIYEYGECTQKIFLQNKEEEILNATEKKACLLSDDGDLIIVDLVDNDGDDYTIIAQGVIDANGSYSSLWYLTDKGEVYELEEWKTTANTKGAVLRAKGAIALSPNMSDATGWFIPGEPDPDYDWVWPELRAKFVSRWPK